MEKRAKIIGKHMAYEYCRFCLSGNVELVINLGNVPLAGGFLEKGTKNTKLKKENFYPLQLNFCVDCFLLQVNTSIDPDILFKNYFYHSSSITSLVDHFKKTVEDLKASFPNPKKTFIVEIGSNDGTFIKTLQTNDFKVLGVDPASNIVKPLKRKGLPVINSYFTEKVAKKIVLQYGQADAIYSFHSLAHIEDMHDVLRAVKRLLKPEGFLAFEVHYLGNLINEMQFDMIYHEHQYYYSLLALKNFFTQFSMEIFDVKMIPIRGGSIMFYVQNKRTGKRKISQKVRSLEKEELQKGFNNIKTYKVYAKTIEKTKIDLLNILDTMKGKGQIIAGYGASGRGTIIMNYCGLNQKYLEYVIDDAPAKHGALTPGTHLKITSSEILHTAKKPDAVVLFAWPFIEEVKKRQETYLKNGGKFIVPLPTVKIVTV